MSRTQRQPRNRRLLAFAPAALFALAACTTKERPLPDLSEPKPVSVSVARVGDDEEGRAVRALVDADFEVRARAARTLVTAGEAALPALGRAGDLVVPVAGGMQVSATRSVVDAILARAEAPAVERHLGSPWPIVRRAAAEELGRRDARSAIPHLIERLDDNDVDVRAASAVSLRRLTNNFLGYQADDSVGGRREAADRWRAWWAQEGLPGRQESAPGNPEIVRLR